MGFTKLEKDVLNISKLPDSVKGNAKELKATFDKAGEDIKKAHNDLIDELAEQNAASNIGAISEEGATTVQAELDKLNDRIHVDFTELEVEVDAEINEESENAIQNKAVAKESKRIINSALEFSNKYTEAIIEKAYSAEAYPYWGSSGSENAKTQPFTNTGSVVVAVGKNDRARFGVYLTSKLCVKEILINANFDDIFWIEASNDGVNWKKLYDSYTSEEDFNNVETKISFENEEEYYIYAVSTKMSSVTITRFDITKWILGNSEFEGTLLYTQMSSGSNMISFSSAILDLPLPNYENDIEIHTKFSVPENMKKESYTYQRIIPVLSALDSNGYTISSSPSMTNLLNAFNSATDNATGSYDTLYSIIMKLPNPKKANRITVAGDLVGGTASSDRASTKKQLFGSNDGTKWTEITMDIGTHAVNSGITIDFPNETAYSYYKLNLRKDGGRSGNMYVGNIKLFERVITEETYTGSNTTMLNVNNLGSKMLLNPIAFGTLYDLIYNGEGWDRVKMNVHGKISKTGSTSEYIQVHLGFKPDLVILRSASTTFTAVIPWNETFKLLDDGFQFSIATAGTYTYEALKL